MTFPKADLIIHPVRFRILQTLMGAELTTQEIAAQLPDVPKSSIYRHLKQLLDGEMIAVADTQLVHGIQEKRYRLQQRPYLGPEDVADMSATDHLRYFTVYILTVLQGFRDYLAKTEATKGKIDMLADRVGYTESYLFLNEEELMTFYKELNELFLRFAHNGPGSARHRHKFALITHPAEETTNGNLE